MKLKFLVIGTKQKKTDRGFISGGDWTLLKCFYEEEGRYGEFYFNFNGNTGEAEIIKKDSNYASSLLKGFEQELKGGEK